jgi:hypothetical protein
MREVSRRRLRYIGRPWWENRSVALFVALFEFVTAVCVAVGGALAGWPDALIFWVAAAVVAFVGRRTWCFWRRALPS